jgi:hypothetical protein
MVAQNKAQSYQAPSTKEGGRVDLRGPPPSWKQKVGFDALARGFACSLQIASKGEPPAYCLSCVAVRRGTACCTYIQYRTCKTAAGPGPVAYVLLVPAPNQGLVEPAVRVYVYRHVVR